MGLFRKRFGVGLSSDLLKKGLLINGPIILGNGEMLIKDPVTEGKKLGYKRAAKEYEIAFKKIEVEYISTKEMIVKQKIKYDSRSEELLNKLEKLEIQKAELENQVKHKIKALSIKHNIPTDNVTKSLAAGTLFMPIFINGGIFGVIRNYQEKKLKEAELRGYAEAKELYEKKIEILKKDLLQLKDKGSNELLELVDLITILFDAISDEQMKIAELKILI